MENESNKNNISHSRFEAILETAVDGIITINSQGIVDSFNPGAEKLFGYSREEVIGNNISMLMPEPDSSRHDEYIRRYEESGEKKVIGIGREVLAKHKDQSIFPVKLSVGEAEIDGKTMYVGIIHDISEYKKQEDELKQHRDHLQKLVYERTNELSLANFELKRLVNMDSLTKLANRRFFDEVLKKEIQRASRNKEPLSFLMCDIDYFKRFNDSYGHIAGDECLFNVAKCLKESFKRTSDLPARYGGEEFAVILPYTNNEELKKLCTKFVANLRQMAIPHNDSDVSDYVTVSIGAVTVIPDKTTEANSVIEIADRKLYAAKENGRNKIEIEDQS